MSRLGTLGGLPLSVKSQFREGNKMTCVHCGSFQITFSYIKHTCTFTCLNCKAKEVISEEELRRPALKTHPAALIRLGE